MGGGEVTGGRCEDDVKSMPKSVYYKVLAEGDATSATPSAGSVITAHYTGASCRVRSVIVSVSVKRVSRII